MYNRLKAEIPVLPSVEHAKPNYDTGYGWKTWENGQCIVLDDTGISKIPWKPEDGKYVLDQERKTEILPEEYLHFAKFAMHQIDVLV